MNPEMVCDGDDIFVVVNGIKVAKRARPGTPLARTWVSLEPGWRVSGTERLDISYDPPEAH
jgi:hypothetical protein